MRNLFFYFTKRLHATIKSGKNPANRPNKTQATGGCFHLCPQVMIIWIYPYNDDSSCRDDDDSWNTQTPVPKKSATNGWKPTNKNQEKMIIKAKSFPCCCLSVASGSFLSFYTEYVKLRESVSVSMCQSPLPFISSPPCLFRVVRLHPK